MKPIRTSEDKKTFLERLEGKRNKGYQFGTQYDDAEERIKAGKKPKPKK